MNEIPKTGIAVDGYCKGNPGPCGYRGVDIATGKVLFKCDMPIGTNNIAEYLGLVHALGFVKKNRKENYGTIYTDSEIAIAWIKLKSCGTKFETGKYPDLAKKIWRCDMFLLETKSLPAYQKWDTKNWGEVPADFGHKNR